MDGVTLQLDLDDFELRVARRFIQGSGPHHEYEWRVSLYHKDGLGNTTLIKEALADAPTPQEALEMALAEIDFQEDV